DAVLRAAPAVYGKGEEDPPGQGRRQAIRQPEVRVCLSQCGGDAPGPGGQHHGPRDVAASTIDDVGSASSEDAPARERGGEGDAERARERDSRLARQAGDGERVQLEAG